MGATWPRRPLKTRELQVLTLAANGRSNVEIGAELCISEETVKSHLRRVNAALGTRSRVHAVAIALAAEILVPGDVVVPDGREGPRRRQKLLTILLECLGQEVCLRLIGGKLVPCEVAAIMAGNTVGVFTAPGRQQRRYRFTDIDTIMRQERING
jgi:DNA-binding CsgD family transcriptional regulator